MGGILWGGVGVRNLKLEQQKSSVQPACNPHGRLNCTAGIILFPLYMVLLWHILPWSLLFYCGTVSGGRTNTFDVRLKAASDVQKEGRTGKMSDSQFLLSSFVCYVSICAPALPPTQWDVHISEADTACVSHCRWRCSEYVKKNSKTSKHK